MKLVASVGVGKRITSLDQSEQGGDQGGTKAKESRCTLVEKNPRTKRRRLN